MGIGSYLSTKSVVDVNKRKLEEEKSEIENSIEKEPEKPPRAGIFMFFSYVVGGFIPILSYLFFPISSAIRLVKGARQRNKIFEIPRRH